MLSLAEADAELQRLALLKKSHLDEQFMARRAIRDLPGRIQSLNDRLAKLSADAATVKEHAGAPLTIGARQVARDEATAALGERLEALPILVRDSTRVPLGTYRGLDFGVVVHPNFPPDVYLQGAVGRSVGLSQEHQGPRAVLNALERLAAGYAAEMAEVREDLTVAESQRRDYQARLGQPFSREAYLSDLTGLRDQLKAKLSASERDAGDDVGPTTTDFAGQIKTLRAAQTVETCLRPTTTLQK